MAEPSHRKAPARAPAKADAALTGRPAKALNAANALKAAKATKPGVREAAAMATRDAILRAATKVFAKHGFAGGRIEMISTAAKSCDRMIYYYFGSKEALFIAVIEHSYRRFNEAEQALVLDVGQPQQALSELIRFVWRYYQKNPEFIALLNTENLLRGKHVGKRPWVSEYSSPVIAITERLLRSGAALGLFRADLSARDVYLMIAAMAYFYLSNRYTLSSFLGENLAAPEALAHWEAFVIDAVQRTVGQPPPTPA